MSISPAPSDPGVQRWVALFDPLEPSAWSAGYAELSSTDAAGLYKGAYYIDAYTSMYEATGSTAYLDKAVALVQASIAACHTSSDGYQVKVLTSDYHGADWVGEEAALDDSYCWRFVSRLIRVMPAGADRASLLAWTEANIWNKWVARGMANLYRSNTHMRSHWGVIAANLWAVTGNTAYRTVAEQIITDFRGQLHDHPVVGASACWWNEDFGLHSLPGQDVAHGNALAVLVADTAATLGAWTGAERDRFQALTRWLATRPTPPDFIDGSGTGSGWMPEWVKLAGLDEVTYSTFDSYPVDGQAQYRANMAAAAASLATTPESPEEAEPMAVRFDAVGDRLIGTTGLPVGDYTYTCWVKVAVSRGDNVFAAFAAMESATGSASSALSVYYTGNQLWVYTDTSGNPARTTLTIGSWYKVAVTVTGTSLSYYVGPEGGSLALIGTEVNNNAARARLTIGSDVFDEWINGSVAAFKMWSAVLSVPEMEAELAQYAPVRTSGLNRYYPFTALPGTTDESGNGNNLTAGSTAVTLETGPSIPPGGSSAVDLVVRPARATSRATRPLLAQTSTLTMRAARAASRATRPLLGQSTDIALRASRAATRASTALLAQTHSLTVRPARAGAAATTPLLTQASTLAVSGARSASRATVALLGQLHELAVRDARAETRAERPLLAVVDTLIVRPARAASRATRPLLEQSSDLVVRSARAASYATRALLAGPVGEWVRNPTRVSVEERRGDVLLDTPGPVEVEVPQGGATVVADRHALVVLDERSGSVLDMT